MRLTSTASAFVAGLLFASLSFGQSAPAGAPAGTTGMCKDGSYYSGATKKGACRGHKGVQDWYGAPTTAAAPAAAAAAAPAAASAPAVAAAPATAPTPAAAAKASGKSVFTPPAIAAAGGGAGQVWVNHKSKVYHCSGDRWYGKTKDGEYMTEADATAKGNRPDHGKACK